ncbi:MAG TPA: efflux RND transporter periplasmic adaptor subunit [Xanthobacteraceae bacterium]
MRAAHPRVLSVATAAMVLAACGQDNRYVAPPPPKVTVATPVQQPVTRYLEVTGSAAAVNSADLVARVPGFLHDISYVDGALVKKGMLLFTIEPEPYDVKLQQAKAAEAGAQATLKQAQSDFDRQAKLVTTQAASQATYDQSLATRDSAQASYLQAQANTKLAALNNDYAHVTAPFDGIVTARQVSVGEFVGGAATPTVLASIVQTDPIYVTFNVSEQDVLRLRAEMARRGLTRDDLLKVPVEVGLQTETGYPHAGTFNYAAPTVNTSTGTLAARAVFQNPERVLLPGYFVRVRIPVEQQPNALLVPDVALGSDQSGRYVLVVDEDNVVAQRKVSIGPLVDELRVIDMGLNPDDRVVVAGVLRAIPGQKVDPQAQATKPASASGAPGAH